MKYSSTSHYIFWAVVACVLWSTASLGIKIGLRYVPPLTFAGMRFMGAGILLIPFCPRKETHLQSILSEIPLILKISFFQTFVLYACFFWGVNLVPGALAAIAAGAGPLVTAIVAHFAMPDDRLNISKFWALILGMAGIGIISLSKNPLTTQGFTEFFGVLLIIIGLTASAIANVYVAKDRSGIHPVVLTAMQIFIGGLGLFLVGIMIEGAPQTSYPIAFWMVLLWLASVSAIAFSLWFILIQKPGIKLSDLNMWKFIIPVLGAVLNWIFIPEESPELISILGMVLVGGSIIWYNNALHHT